MLSNLSKRFSGLDQAFRTNLSTGLDTVLFAEALEQADSVCIVASGNSAYPAYYLQLLLNRMQNIPPVFCKTPLEYLLEAPRHAHVCMLVSYSVKNIDSNAVVEFCRKNGTALFLLTGVHSTSLPAVQTVVDDYGAGHVFTAVLGSLEKGFVSILGTTALFALSLSLACSLGLELHSSAQDMGFPESVRSDNAIKPLHGNRMVLHGPLGRPAALALAGLHTETISPLMTYDLKNVTHGVWRSLQDNGPYSLYVLRDTATAPLADFVMGKLGQTHQCIVIQNESSAMDWPFEAIGLYASALDAYGSACVEKRERDPKWNPLFVNMDDYESCKGLISQFSMLDLVSSDWMERG